MIKIKCFTIIVLSLIINSCNGQERKNETKQSINSPKTENSKPNIYNTAQHLVYSDINNQISQVVRTILQDSKGNFWFGTQNGAFKFDGNSFTHIASIISEDGKGVTIKDITESNDGKIWFGHTDGISSVDGNIVTNYYKKDGLISNDVWSIAADKKGKIWVGTIDGISVFNNKEFTEFILPEGKIDSTVGISSTKIVHNIFEDSKGILWFSSNAGLFSYTNDTLINVSKKTGIQSSFVNEIMEDKNGMLWISTKQGLYKLVYNKAINITEGKIKIGKGIGSIAEDKDGKIWFVSNQHYLYTYDGKEIKEIQKSEENKQPVIFQIYKDQDNKLWFVGFGGAFRLENGKYINITKNGPW
jgi:ligand-binding sensor domain-containing protein